MYQEWQLNPHIQQQASPDVVVRFEDEEIVKIIRNRAEGLCSPLVASPI